MEVKEGKRCGGGRGRGEETEKGKNSLNRNSRWPQPISLVSVVLFVID